MNMLNIKESERWIYHEMHGKTHPKEGKTQVFVD
jgi:hypothetical protein